MKNLLSVLIFFISVFMLFAACDKEEQPPMVSVEQGLISRDFKDNNTYIIVCRGYPEEGATGVAKTSSAKMAAVLSAQFFAKEAFTGQVDVVREGSVLKYEYKDDHVVVHYQVKKPGLRRYIKK